MATESLEVTSRLQSANAEDIETVETNTETCEDCKSNSVKRRDKPVGGDLQIDQLNFESVNLNDDGEVADISEDDVSKADLQKSKHKKKVKKKRRTKSTTTSNEEDSSTDEDVVRLIKVRKGPSKTDLSNMSWMLWLWYYITAISVGAYHFAEYLGEKLADFFGITAPKYQYVIDEYYRMKREEKEEQEREERERQHVQMREANRLAQLEGGDEFSERFTVQEDHQVSNSSLADKKIDDGV